MMSLPHLRVIITIHQVFNDVIIVLLFTSLVYHSQSQNNIIMNYFILKIFYQRTVVQIYKQFFNIANIFAFFFEQYMGFKPMAPIVGGLCSISELILHKLKFFFKENPNINSLLIM